MSPIQSERSSEPSLVINNLIGILYSSPLKIFEIFVPLNH